MRIFPFLILLILTCSCNKHEKHHINRFITTSIENSVIVSAKTNFEDTLFYENRYSKSTEYFYILLTKQQNADLKKLITNLEVEESTSAFTLSQGEQIFIIDSGEIKFYKKNYLNLNKNHEKINNFFREVSYGMVRVDTIKNFWNFGNIVPPPNPGKEVNKLIFNNNSR